tara:strand:- start:27 stop:707 length:681 start_codon:yes stop_codon:yes gene_type:complete
MNDFYRDTEKWDSFGRTFRRNSHKFFVEIGSADFDTLLPLARNGWSGIIVEPNSFLFNNLIKYENVMYENVAILDYDGKTEFKYYDPDFLEKSDPVQLNEQMKIEKDHAFRGISTADLSCNAFNTLYRHKEHERIIEVDCITLDTLLNKYMVDRIDYLKVDAENKDYAILENYSWRIKPTLIKVESLHWDVLSRNLKFDVEDKVKELLSGMGYIVYAEKQDLYAIR